VIDAVTTNQQVPFLICFERTLSTSTSVDQAMQSCASFIRNNYHDIKWVIFIFFGFFYIKLKSANFANFLIILLKFFSLLGNFLAVFFNKKFKSDNFGNFQMSFKIFFSLFFSFLGAATTVKRASSCNGKRPTERWMPRYCELLWDSVKFISQLIFMYTFI
jgi:hypothetical protein